MKGYEFCMPTATKKANKLIHEKSPYLLQHAYNPVDWFPWGDEAFTKAKVEDKPIFLSIGYSTCHWCHVMERESFEDEEVARILNRDFIAIKVDREERPDIDHIYMNVCHALTGHGGWPLTIIMTPEQKPFFAGTYFPKNDRMGMQGLLTILERVSNTWKNKRNELLDYGEKIIKAVNQTYDEYYIDLDVDIAEEVFTQFKYEFDSKYGGFGEAPKFPTPHNLYFLLRYWYNTGDDTALYMVEKTLDSMYKGGIYDHIGFGFSRYSTDKKWLVPHFEKMLYDNALLAIAYLEAYQTTKKQKYADIADEIFQYVLRDMTSPEGGFYSAEDADSEGEEGKFYVWTVEEIKEVLGEEAGTKYCSYFNITEKGNFEGKNIPNLINTDINEENIEFINTCRQKLFEHREKRIHPHKDDKILTAWNGLMIAAMAFGGRVLNNKKYIISAENAVKFIYEKLLRSDGRLLARYRNGESAFPAYADDYAFLTWGLIELYETTFKPEYLQRAIMLSEDLIKYFWDEKNGGLFVYGSDGEQLVSRPKEIYDGATPSANSVTALNFIRLSRLTGQQEYEKKADEILKAFCSSIANYPRGYIFALTALQYLQTLSKEVVIVTKTDDITEAKEMLDIINEDYRPFTLTLLYSSNNDIIKEISPFVSEYKAINGKTTAYICENYSCHAPLTDIDELRKMISN